MLIPNIQKKLAAIHHQKLFRQRFVISERSNGRIVSQKKSFINFSSNDYLGLANHSKVKKAFIKGINQYGLGGSASALVSGFYKPQLILEEKFAEFLNRDRAILFNSGYHANLAVMSVLADHRSTVVSDKYCHASIIDGIVLSRARHIRYRHNDLSHCETLLAKNHSHTLLVTEGIFSIQGDISPMNKIAGLAQRYSSTLIVDDAHGIGVLGKTGKGICEYYSLSQKDIPCLVTPLGKAFGSMGAIVSGDADLIENFIQCARSYRYTTALFPAAALSLIAALQVIVQENWRYLKLQQLIRFFELEAARRNLQFNSTDCSPIKCLLIGNNNDALAVQERLMQKDVFVACIRPPSVPKSMACIRISLNFTHNETDILFLLDLLADFYGCK